MSVPGQRVVVGVDGTERSVVALRWAAFEALKRDAELVAVHAFGAHGQLAPYAPAHVSLAADSEAAQAVKRLDGCIMTAFGHYPPVPVRTVCDSRRPVPALLDHGKGAALLVLAGRPDPFQRGTVLGSIAVDCLRHAPWPIVLLPVTASATPRTRV